MKAGKDDWRLLERWVIRESVSEKPWEKWKEPILEKELVEFDTVNSDGVVLHWKRKEDGSYEYTKDGS